MSDIPLVIPASSGGDVGPTALEYIHALAEETAEFGMGVTTADSTTTTLIFDRLVNSTLDATEFAGMFILIEGGACAGQVGHVLGGGLNRSSGTITIGDPFTQAIESGTSFSIYRLCPPVREGGVVTGLLEVVNQSLRRLSVPDRISFSGVDQQKHYSIDTETYPWWSDPNRIMWVEYPVTASDDVPRRMDPTQWDWLADGETRRLYFPSAPFRTGETFAVRVMRPGNSRLKTSGAWTDQATQTAGLVELTDRAIPDVADVVTMGKARLYEMLSNLKAPSAVVSEWLAKKKPNIMAARQLQHLGTSEDRTFGVVSLRPTRSYQRGYR